MLIDWFREFTHPVCIAPHCSAAGADGLGAITRIRRGVRPGNHPCRQPTRPARCRGREQEIRTSGGYVFSKRLSARGRRSPANDHLLPPRSPASLRSTALCDLNSAMKPLHSVCCRCIRHITGRDFWQRLPPSSRLHAGSQLFRRQRARRAGQTEWAA